MPEIEPGEEEYTDEDANLETEQEFEDESIHEQNEQSARPFFALLSFLMAAICLAVFLTRPLASITGLFVMFGVLVFGIGGMLLLEHKPVPQHPIRPAMLNEDRATKFTIVDSTLARVEREDEEDQEALSPFERLVEEALSSIPPEFQEKMANLAILVESRPDEEALKRVGAKEGYTLLGLYQGVPLTTQGYAGTMLPERITIYQQTIEAYCHGDPQRIRQQVRSTVLHEVAHHFGMAHEEMPIWIK